MGVRVQSNTEDLLELVVDALEEINTTLTVTGKTMATGNLTVSTTISETIGEITDIYVDAQYIDVNAPAADLTVLAYISGTSFSIANVNELRMEALLAMNITHITIRTGTTVTAGRYEVTDIAFTFEGPDDYSVVVTIADNVMLAGQTPDFIFEREEITNGFEYTPNPAGEQNVEIDDNVIVTGSDNNDGTYFVIDIIDTDPAAPILIVAETLTDGGDLGSLKFEDVRNDLVITHSLNTVYTKSYFWLVQTGAPLSLTPITASNTITITGADTINAGLSDGDVIHYGVDSYL